MPLDPPRARKMDAIRSKYATLDQRVRLGVQYEYTCRHGHVYHLVFRREVNDQLDSELMKRNKSLQTLVASIHVHCTCTYSLYMYLI